MNRIVKEEEPKGMPENTGEESRKFTETVRRFAEFDFRLNPEQIRRQTPFLVYLCFLVMLFIYNGHRSENMIRETDRLHKEIKDLRSEYISELSDLMNESKQSAVAQKLAVFGIKELNKPPSKITYRVDK